MKNATSNQPVDDFRGHNFAIYECIEAMSLLPVLYYHILSDNLKGHPCQCNIFIFISL